jgi:phosphinothricin acetyltransferase
MIRDATAADIPAIGTIWNLAVRETIATFSSEEKTPEGLAALLAERQARYAFVVAEVEGSVAGFATYGQFRAGNGYRFTFEHTIYLGPETRGRGVGRVLMGAIETHARGVGGHSMIGGVSAANAPSVAFHLALGYTTTALLPQAGYKFDRWHDLLLMQKLL